MIIPVILAGGLGTRLWPLSRPDTPKPLIRLDGPLSMIQQTVRRAVAIPDSGRPVIVCGIAHHPSVARQMEELCLDEYLTLQEPAGRGTAPAAAAAAVVSDPDDLLLVMPADHIIEDTNAFISAVGSAAAAARAGWLVTFGVTPDHPETGYGYIERGSPIKGLTGTYRIASFREKPDRATAIEYLESGHYWWNSGMFLFKAGTFRDELRKFEPEILVQVEAAVQQSESRGTGSGGPQGKMLDHDSFLNSPKGSIDRTVMERTQRGAVVPLTAGWNDIGSWAALWETGSKDGQANVVSGSAHLYNVSSSYVRAQDRPVVVIGLDRIIVVDAGDAILVAGMDHAQAVKEAARNSRSEPGEPPLR